MHLRAVRFQLLFYKNGSCERLFCISTLRPFALPLYPNTRTHSKYCLPYVSFSLFRIFALPTNLYGIYRSPAAAPNTLLSKYTLDSLLL